MYDLSVTIEGREAYTVSTDGRDVRAWEATFGESWFEKDSASYTDVTFLAYSASKRAGLFGGDWETFDAQCIAVRDVTAEGPTRETSTEKEATGD
jgi:hypothetical protein